MKPIPMPERLISYVQQMYITFTEFFNEREKIKPADLSLLRANMHINNFYICIGISVLVINDLLLYAGFLSLQIRANSLEIEPSPES